MSKSTSPDSDSNAASYTNRRVDWLINVLSVVIPVVVALLLGIRTKFDLGTWTQYLPHAIGAINSLTSICLISGWIALKAKKIAWHRWLMTSAFVLGGVFLVCYVTYHVSNPSTAYGGQGLWRSVYYFILISHIGLSLIVLPLVLRAFLFGVTDQFVKHRRVSKFAFPIWLYVSVTGVIVYAMISPYYQHGDATLPASLELPGVELSSGESSPAVSAVSVDTGTVQESTENVKE